MKFLAFAASHRKESINRKLVGCAARYAKDHGAQVDSVEYSALDMPIYDNETYAEQPLPAPAERFVKHLGTVDGLIIASPEYNWSFPGSLKNIIDWASVVKPNPFAGKTALLLSASPSLRGGAQGLIHLRVPLEALEMYVYPRIFCLSRAAAAFGPDAMLSDVNLAQELSDIVAGFTRMTGALTAP